MTGALVLTRPALLCGVMAWDLSRPAKPRAAGPDSRPSPASRAVGALLAGCAAVALSASWLPTSAGSGVLAGGVAVALTAVATAGHRRRLPVPASSPGGLAAVPAELV